MKKMKKILFAFFIGTITLASCSKDPCKDVSCPNLKDTFFCENGQCPCETNNWSYILWEVECTNCGIPFAELPIDLEINGSKVTDLTLRISENHYGLIRAKLINSIGQVPYKITAGSILLEEGFFNLQTCEELRTKSLIQI